MKKLLCLFLAILLFAASGVTAGAISTEEATEKIDVSRTDCTLTVSLAAAAACNVTLDVKLHMIAEVSADFQYELLSPYPSVDLNGISTQSEWNTVRDTIGAYISADKIEPFRTVSTDTSGRAIFSDLCPGLYYVEGCSFSSGTTTYSYAPFLVTVPELGTDGTWNYDTVAVPKHSETTEPEPEPSPEPEPEPSPTPEQDKKQYTVIKVWKTETGISHPDSVDVELYKNGSLSEKLTLSAENNWMYTWSDDTDSVWTAVERDVPDGYTVSISGERVITIINTENGKRPTPVNPDHYNPPRTGDTSSTRLYILLLAVSGAGLISLALLRRKKKHE